MQHLPIYELEGYRMSMDDFVLEGHTDVWTDEDKKAVARLKVGETVYVDFQPITRVS
jgi:hypothetical protein